ncbi:hypothetical protein CVV38_02225 [Candidatus Peregrinibacteria bacterium HGW-Peregrinibacteria-1]|jgi:DNA polymerase III subunit gamma/tau|nr:MAG: hypothetical protein CVV38_02225 [Candidatus Peregrinibacteria bacterium HGW-Peregrinibacteria-1]
MSLALYRKYRPENFENLVGQDVVQTTIKNAIQFNKLAQAYVFSGPRGTGKTSTARLIAKALNCEALVDGFSPCDKCEFCVDIAKGNLMDVVEIDAASNNGVDHVRDLVDKINFAPTRSKYKVYIVDEVHMMSKGAFNALLKTLEEPPEYVYFILATTEIHKIPETILSRCQRFDFKRIGNDDIRDRLKVVAESEGFEFEIEALEMIARFVNGGMRDALVALEKLAVVGKITVSLVRDNLGISDFRECKKMMDLLLGRNMAEAMEFVGALYEEGTDLRQFLKDFIEVGRDMLLESVNAGGGDILRIMEIIDLAIDAGQMFGKTSIVQLPLEIMVVKACGEGVSVGRPPVKDAGRPPVKDAVLKERVITAAVAKRVKPVEKTVKEEPRLEVKVSSGHAAKGADVPSLDEVRRSWTLIADSVVTPSLKMSIKTLDVLSVEDGILKIGVNSTFHLEKVSSGVRDLEAAIQKSKGWVLRVQFTLIEKARDFQRIEPSESPRVPYSENQEKSSSDSVDLALDMFGGEVVN